MTEDIGPNTALCYSHSEQIVENGNVQVVVIQEILCDARHRRTQGIGHGEQQNTGQRGLVLCLHPIQNLFEATFVVREEEMDDEEHPGKSQCTDDDDVKRNGKGAHTSPRSSRSSD